MPLLLLRIHTYLYYHPLGCNMKAHKTISLDAKTAIIAGRIPNFSAWVRRKLLEHARSAQYEGGGPVELQHIAPPSARVWGDNNDKCNPKHRNGLCDLCYGDA